METYQTESGQTIPARRHPAGLPLRLEGRATRYTSLAELLRVPMMLPLSAISGVLTPCDDCERYNTYEMRLIRAAGSDADRWCRVTGDLGALIAEHGRLFGDEDAGVAPAIHATELAYCTRDPALVLDDLTGLYTRYGFEAPPSRGRADGRAHVATELAFMGHCLGCACSGVDGARSDAYQFFRVHLQPWLIVFAAALVARAANPVVRFAGLALEQFAFCEGQAARREACFGS